MKIIRAGPQCNLHLQPITQHYIVSLAHH